MVVVLVEVMVVVVSPLLLFPAEQILIAYRNSAVVLERDVHKGYCCFWSKSNKLQFLSLFDDVNSIFKKSE